MPVTVAGRVVTAPTFGARLMVEEITFVGVSIVHRSCL
jgi:hypothetical protein